MAMVYSPLFFLAIRDIFSEKRLSCHYITIQAFVFSKKWHSKGTGFYKKVTLTNKSS